MNEPSPRPSSTLPERLIIVSTGRELEALSRMEEGLASHAGMRGLEVQTLRLGQVESLLHAYINAARLLDDPRAILLFAHQDVRPALPATGQSLTLPDAAWTSAPWLRSAARQPQLWVDIAGRLLADDNTGWLGVAGSTRLSGGIAWWNEERLSGAVLHRQDGAPARLNAYGPWSRVAMLDGLLLMARGDIFQRIDAGPVPDSGFHFYDAELALRAHRAGLASWTVPLLLEHDSGGAPFDEEGYRQDRLAFARRHRELLPLVVEPTPTPGLDAP